MPNVVVYDTQSHEYFVMIEDEKTLELTKDNVEDFFSKIKDGSILPSGGNGFGELIQKMIVDVVKFFVVSSVC